MAKSEELRLNVSQHQPKNNQSKVDDKRIHSAMKKCISYLRDRLGNYLDGYILQFDTKISYSDLIKIIRDGRTRNEFDFTFQNRTIKPDGGIIYLKKEDDKEYLKIVLVSEVKKQGTNDLRAKEGKKKQAQGNAIERLGKNLIGIRAALNHHPITPFVCFGHGCDFTYDYGADDFVMSKISMMNEFYKLNRTYVFKQDGSSERNHYSPVSMYFKEEEWTEDEMFLILKEIGETALRYYIF